MRYETAVNNFKMIYIKLYLDKVDYWTAQETWAAYIDSLCKSGEITQKQYDTWATPFPYGKRLKPSYKQLEMVSDTR